MKRRPNLHEELFVFLEVTFLVLVFFGQAWENPGKIPSHHQKNFPAPTPMVYLRSVTKIALKTVCMLLLWRLVTSIQICASLNQCKNKKSESSRLIPQKLSANLELSV